MVVFGKLSQFCGRAFAIQTDPNNFKTFGVVTPAWQLMTEYSHRVVRRTQRGVGGLLFTVTANGWDFEPLRYSLPPVPEVEAKL